ncbi:MAG: Ni/Fe hydrogenase subunit gamma, partial [Actinomycetia bacterium]|nr:Ni/Fe hydrogenase subunit gamma [Actinomycetes bacterium]
MHRVVSRRDEIEDTVTLQLEPVEAAVPPPAPGQFYMLWVFGIGEVPISVAGYDDGTLVHTIRAVGSVTDALCASRVGDLVGVRGPYGSEWRLGSAKGRDVVVVAGGLGIAPIRPIVTEILANRADYGAVALLFGARSPELLLYPEEIAEWRGHFDLDVEVTVDTADPSWRGDVGMVTKLIGRARIDGDNTTAFVCGPEVMMRFAAEAITDRGVAPEQVWLSIERNMHCAIGHCGHC